MAKTVSKSWGKNIDRNQGMKDSGKGGKRPPSKKVPDNFPSGGGMGKFIDSRRNK